jgi:putative membrane protein
MPLVPGRELGHLCWQGQTMNPKLKTFLLRWANNTVAVLIAAKIVPGIHCRGFLTYVSAAFLLGVLNIFLRRILIFLALPLVVVSLGLFILVINAFLLYAVGYLMTSVQAPFHVDSFWAAFWGGLIISIVSLLLNLLIGTSGARIEFRRATPPSNRDGGDGPVIDV